MNIILLSGGSGKRLWPLSNDVRSKQFIRIFRDAQGNYESMSGQGRHVFYEFLCKCDLFIRRFNVPRLTGMFVEEVE